MVPLPSSDYERQRCGGHRTPCPQFYAQPRRHRLNALKEPLVLFRLAFSQPRKQDLLEYLMATFPLDEAAHLVSELCIDLSPVPSR